MENDEITVEGVQFLGCSFWTDFSLFGDVRLAEIEAAEKMVDFRKIRVSPKFYKMRPANSALIHKNSVKWLGEKFKKEGSLKRVVVTHHAPSIRSIPENFSSDILSVAYASNCEDLVKLSKAKLWIHGHIHAKLDYQIENTRVVCNARGYPDEPNEKFQPSFCVEI